MRNIALWASNESPNSQSAPMVSINQKDDCVVFTVRDAFDTTAIAFMPIKDFVKFAATFIQEARS
jgi:hypothetical protein